MKRSVLALVTVVVLASVSVLVAQTLNPELGTWKLNVAKSKYEPGPGPKSNVNTLEAVAGGGRRSFGDQVDAQGKTVHTDITYMFDGKEYVLKGAEPPTTRAYTRIDDRSYQFVTRVQGKVTTTTKLVVAADGKTRTNATTGKDEQGRTVNNIAVWEKQ